MDDKQEAEIIPVEPDTVSTVVGTFRRVSPIPQISGGISLF